MDSDIYFKLDRPHVTWVDKSALVGLIVAGVSQPDLLPKRLKAYHKSTGNGGAGPGIKDVIDSAVTNISPEPVALFDQQLDIGLLLRFDDETEQLNGLMLEPGLELEAGITLTNDSVDLTRYSVKLNNSLSADIRRLASLTDESAPPSPKKRKVAPSSSPIPLCELQILKFDKIATELAILKLSKTLASTVTFVHPTLKLTLESIDSKEATFSGKLCYSLGIADSAKPIDASVAHSDGMRRIFAYVLDNPTFLLHPRNLVQSVNAPMFYELICEPKGVKPRDHIEVPYLSSSLLRYQRETVQWCLRREGKDLDDGGSVVDLDPHIRDFVVAPALGWSPHKIGDVEYWLNPYSGCICTEKTLNQQVESQALTSQPYCGGGLLAEEMGLGKTVEIISLLLLNKRFGVTPPSFKQEVEDEIPTLQPEDPIPRELVKSEPEGDDWPSVYDTFLGRDVHPVKTTLVISPHSIRSQWVDEIRKHAPSLSVYVYRGMKDRYKSGAPSARKLAQYDVVITTYHVISQEVHFALYNPKARNTRFGADRPYSNDLLSPLVKLQFWRVVLDEAQMVHSGVSNAATVARIVPRVHAWAVTGTPIKKDMDDLQGVLIFLRQGPFDRSSRSWSQVLASPSDFKGIFGSLAIRHTSTMVEADISIPLQRRVLFSIPFSSIEDNNYRHLHEDMLKACGLKVDGSPIDTTVPADMAKLSRWLVRLRQACCHARIGRGNRLALGGNSLKTIDDLLLAMYDQATSSLLSDQRRYYNLLLDQGQILEEQKNSKAALLKWESVLKEILPIVEQLREEVEEAVCNRDLERAKNEEERKRRELAELAGEPAATEPAEEDDEDDVDEDDSQEVKVCKQRLRSWIGLLHRCYFFVASGHFQLYETPAEGQEDEMSEEDKAHQEQEKKFYDLAELLRRELLADPIDRVAENTTELTARAANQDFVVLADATVEDKKLNVGIESRNLLDQVNALGQCLNRQADVIDMWREELIKLLSGNLIDQNADPDGEEYGESLDAQEYAFSYLEVIQQVLSDRSEAVLGSPDPTMGKAVAPTIEETDFQKNLQKEREALRPIQGAVPGASSFEFSLAGYLGQVKELIHVVGGTRGTAEREMLHILRAKIQSIHDEQKKQLKELSKEVSFFSELFNARVAYYRQLQEISDDVAAVEIEEKDLLKKKMREKDREVASLRGIINQQLARYRYLSTLKKSGADDKESWICVICQSSFVLGALTVCGHQFCQDCLKEWWGTHKNCPLCKRHLVADEVYNFTNRPQGVEMTEMDGSGDQGADDIRISELENGIYSVATKRVIDEISNISVSRSYGSKIDFIVRHLTWLRTEDRRAQVVVFSQWSEMLELIRGALTRSGIKYASVDFRMDEFKTDPSIACFLLHAKSESAGLTLVNARHVYLCEPLVNTALEVQAISRIHRIGQTQPTTVWLFTISDTVEEAIFLLSSRKRLEYLKQVNKLVGPKPAAPISEEVLDASNSHELAQSLDRMVDKSSGGEVVGNEDLWTLLFGDVKRDSTATITSVD